MNGTENQKRRILLCLCHMGGHEMEYIEEAFRENWITPLGPNVTGFEQDLEHFIRQTTPGAELTPEARRSLQEKRVVALASGTSAVHLALVECGVQPGDEVMVQSFTFAATSNPIAYLGAEPVFVDSEAETWNMDPELLNSAIADRVEKTGRKPRAIVVAYLYGMPAKIDELKGVADYWGIPLIEDSAEAFGSMYKGRQCGTYGRYGVMSFNGNKMITTSGGGALICPDESSARKTLFLATQAREPYPYYQHEEIGYNYRMSNICAGIGRGQMKILDEHLAHHRHVQSLYRELLADVEGITLHENPSADYDSNFWLSAITLDDDVEVKGQEEAGGDIPRVEALRRGLDSVSVESRPLWKPLHMQPVYSGCPRYLNGVSEDLFSRGLCLPAGPWVTDEDVRLIVDTIRSLTEKKKESQGI